MIDLTVCVISYKRPHLLRDTLTSIRGQLHGITARVIVVDNATSPGTRAVIEAANPDAYFLLSENKGINWPLENLIAPDIDSEFLCVSDHDIHYTRPFKTYLDFLKANPDVSYCKGLASPEHPAFGHREHQGEQWTLKKTERGGGLVMSKAKFCSTLPLPTHALLDWDWHCVYKGGTFAVLPGTMVHTGYRNSTWQSGPTRETHVLVDGQIVELNAQAAHPTSAEQCQAASAQSHHIRPSSATVCECSLCRC